MLNAGVTRGGVRVTDDLGLAPSVVLARRCAEAMYAADRASQALGIRIEDVAPGRATARMRVTETMINGHDICHGGYVALLADTAFAFACNTYNARTVAQGCDVTFLEPARVGDELVAEAVERVRRDRSGVYDVTVRRTDGGVIAEFRGRSRTVPGTLVDVADAEDGQHAEPVEGA